MLVGRLWGGSPATSAPSIRISPSLGCSKPATIRSVVVLPQPLGPSRVKNSPEAELEAEVVDGDEVTEALAHAPKLDARYIVVHAPSYPWIPDWSPFRR